MPAELKALGDFIGAVGFPAFVACVLLWQFFHMHKENHAAIDRMAAAIETLAAEVRKLGRRRQG